MGVEIVMNMTLKMWCVLAILILPLQAQAAEWDWSGIEIVREVASTGLTIADWGQTNDIRNHNGMIELNPILGRSPSRGAVNTYFGTVLVLHPIITALLPRTASVFGMGIQPRAAWQYFYLGVEWTAISSNYKGGLRMSF